MSPSGQTHQAGRNTTANHAYDSDRFSVAAFLVTLTAVTLLAVWVSAPVIVPLLLAALTAGLAEPLRSRLDRRLPLGRRFSSGATILVLVVVILAPLFIAVFLAARSLSDLISEALDNTEPLRESVQGAIDRLRFGPLGAIVGPRGLADTETVFEALSESMGGVVEGLTEVALNIPRFALSFLIYLYALYFFLADGPMLMRELTSAIPLRAREKETFSTTFLSVGRATLKGILVMGGIQGVIGGLVFLVLGLPAPVLFGVLFAILAAIPNFGAVLIWLPAAIILAVSGDTVRAVLMLILGGGVIAGADYLIRPLIIRSDSQLHQVLALAGIIGGIAAFGIVGLLFGPIVMSLFVAAWRTFRGRFHTQLHDVGTGKA
jgi:predicted PurR-regulated permease PerM